MISAVYQSMTELLCLKTQQEADYIETEKIKQELGDFVYQE